jgi:hypothetical protein
MLATNLQQEPCYILADDQLTGFLSTSTQGYLLRGDKKGMYLYPSEQKTTPLFTPGLADSICRDM